MSYLDPSNNISQITGHVFSVIDISSTGKKLCPQSFWSGPDVFDLLHKVSRRETHWLDLIMNYMEAKKSP